MALLRVPPRLDPRLNPWPLPPGWAVPVKHPPGWYSGPPWLRLPDYAPPRVGPAGFAHPSLPGWGAAGWNFGSGAIPADIGVVGIRNWVPGSQDVFPPGSRRA